MYLIGDLGATHLRLALIDDLGRVRDNKFVRLCTLQAEGYADLYEPLEYFLTQSPTAALKAACLALAGPVFAKGGQMINQPWFAELDKLSQILRCANIHLLNDFAAQAYQLMDVPTDKCLAIGQAENPEPNGMRAIIGPGSGLGSNGLLYRDGQYHSIASEFGYGLFAPQDPLAGEILKYWQAELGRVCWEHLLSGPGLVRIYQALCAIEDTQEQQALSAIAIGQSQAALCQQALALFCAYLGDFAAQLALALDARQGVYISGGFMHRYQKQLMQSDFRTRFESAERMSVLLKRIPSYLVNIDQAGLIGAANYLRQRLAN